MEPSIDKTNGAGHRNGLDQSTTTKAPRPKRRKAAEAPAAAKSAKSAPAAPDNQPAATPPEPHHWWGDGAIIPRAVVEQGENALAEYTVAHLQYESERDALRLLRQSGQFNRHAQRSQSAYHHFDDLSMRRAHDRLTDAGNELSRACEHMSISLHQSTASDALDWCAKWPFAHAVVDGLESTWLFYLGEPAPAEERLELIGRLAMVFLVLRKIESEYERDERRRDAVENAENAFDDDSRKARPIPREERETD